LDLHSIGRLDPDPHSKCGADPGGLKRAKMKREKNAAKRQTIRHKKYKNQCTVIGIKMFI
jgi:hypothetical protein